MLSLEDTTKVGVAEEQLGNLKDAEKGCNDVLPEDVSVNYSESDDILAKQDVDPALNAKMHIVNNVRWIPEEIFPSKRAFICAD